MTRIAVVSDTHGNLLTTRQAVARLEALQPDLIVHCGDIGSTEVIACFDRWPTHFVFGNTDYNESDLTQGIEIAGQHCHERFGTLEVQGKQIAFLHSDDRRLFQQTIDSGEYDLVCYGHSHIALLEQRGKTLVLNPGALHRARVYSFAVVEFPELSCRFEELS